MIQNLCFNYRPILLTVSLSPVFLPNERFPFLNFRKARQDDFAFYFDSHCPFAEKYSFLFLSFAAVLLTIWCSGQTALILSLLAKAALAYLPTALTVASRPPLSFQQAPYAQVFPLKPAPSCTLFAGLGSTNKSAISLLFSYYLTLALSSSPCSLLHLFSYLNLCQKLFFLFSSSIRLQWDHDSRFFRTTTRLMSWPDGERYLFPQQRLVVTLLLSLMSTLFFSDWRHTVSSKFFDTQALSISTSMCFYLILAASSLAFAATDTAFC